jgi:hypothetical protein
VENIWLWPEASIGKREGKMAKMILDFSDEHQMKVEAILMDNDAQEALRFLKEIVKPKIRSKGLKELDAGKSAGVPT